MSRDSSNKEDVKSDKKKLFIPIGFKIITITSFIVIISLLAVALISSYFFREDNQVKAMGDTLSYSTLISKKIDSDLLSIIDKTRMAFIIMDFKEDSKVNSKMNSKNEDIKNTIDDLLFKLEPDIVCVAVFKKGENNPNAFFKSRDSLLEESSIIDSIKAEKNSFDRVFKGDTVVLNFSAYFKEPLIGLAVPFGDAYSTERILLIMLSMDKITEIISSPGVIKSFIVNSSGDVIGHYDSSIARSKVNLSSLKIVEMMMANSNPNGQTFYTDEKGDRYLAAFHRLEFGDSAVISIVEESVAFGSVYKILRIIFYITLISLAFAVIFILIFSKSLTNPIRRLVSAASMIQGGDFSVVVPETTRDEIGRLSVSFTNMAHGLAEREKIKDAFSKFVNKEVAELALKGDLKLGGEIKKVAVFFSDIRSFTAMSEKLQPDEVVDFLNEYMTLMVKCVNDTNGSVDKFIGDAIMAVWGVPVSRGNDTENAVNSALLMREVLLKFNKGRGSLKKPIINIGCGINTGPVVAGQIGSEDRMEYTVIGDTVNFASRIEALNKPFGTDILISADSYNTVKGIFNVAPMKKVKVKGKNNSQQIYAVLGRKDDPNCPKNILALRKFLGIKPPAAKTDSHDEENEVKYEIIE
ncbi:MAG: HAMP domain-containing protein [Leptospirales bacterium]|nr:HAMP domain-containing protein [Leptospirales bacterium]